MASSNLTPATVSKKRKHAAYLINEGITKVKVGTRIYSIHTDVIEREIDKGAFPRLRKKCATNMLAATFRGFVHWLYSYELPLDEVIKQEEFPQEWVNGSEENPLACSLAIELYVFALDHEIWKLCADSTSFLFRQYRHQRIPPSLARVKRLIDQVTDLDNFDAPNLYESELIDLFMDLHLKFDGALHQSLRPGFQVADCPPEFLKQIFQRHHERVYEDSNTSDSGTNSHALYLSDYHNPCPWDEHDEYCDCPTIDGRKIHVIE